MMLLLLSVNRSSYTDNTAKITNIQLIHFIYLFIYVFIIFTCHRPIRIIQDPNNLVPWLPCAWTYSGNFQESLADLLHAGDKVGVAGSYVHQHGFLHTSGAA